VREKDGWVGIQLADGAHLQTRTIPFLLANNDKTFDGGAFKHWPELPFIANLLFRFWFFPKNKRLWRFGCTTVTGRPKALPFAEKKDN
jgi:hypothetical protein